MEKIIPLFSLILLLFSCGEKTKWKNGADIGVQGAIEIRIK